ncbi:MAG: flagellar biosynthetic protein FliR [Campylobacterota bacterium]
MEALLSLLNENILYEFLLLFARILAFVGFMPIFSDAAVSVRVRVALAFYMSIFLYPVVDVTTSVTQDTFILGLISEITLGAIASLFFHVMFAAVKIIGDFVGYSTALSMAMMFDPSTGSQEGLVSRLLYWIILAFFFQTGMYEMTIIMLAKSFSMIHLGAFDIFSYDGIQLAIDEIKRMFAFAFAFALPLFFIGFIMDVYYGYGTKSMPAFSPFVITFQMKFGLIFLFLLFGMDIFTSAFNDYFIDKFR